ncbi:MAG: 3'(2'),5'-bisphosphate nucleotidase CysQ [Actinobacteria bacterium]|nr:3'(2'),5'-bisphosphate nucleotidase CysQ [Actinomycetota bacterium]
MTEPVAETDAELAARLATEAGHLLVALRDELTAAGASSWHLMDAGDLASHRFLVDALRTHRPDDAVLSEEGTDDPRRFVADRVWIVDPLDGTNEYGERGRSDWAVHVALCEAGQLTAAAVSLPAHGLTLASDPAPVVPPSTRARPRMITSRNRVPYGAVQVARALGCDAIRLGSAGAKAMTVVLGEADIYLHHGGMYQWDSAAPVGVALAAGLHATRIDGSAFVYNERDVWMPDLLICRPELAQPVLDVLWGEDRSA